MTSKEILEGNELEKTYDEGAGKFVLDVDAHGNVKFSNTYEKDLKGYAKVSSQNSIETNIFNIAEKIAAETETTWDDSAVKALKGILGIE